MADELADGQGFVYRQGLGGIQPVMEPGGHHRRIDSHWVNTSLAPSGYSADGTPVYEVDTTSSQEGSTDGFAGLGLLFLLTLSVVLAPLAIVAVLLYVGFAMAFERIRESGNGRYPASESRQLPPSSEVSTATKYCARVKKTLMCVWTSYKRFWNELLDAN